MPHPGTGRWPRSTFVKVTSAARQSIDDLPQPGLPNSKSGTSLSSCIIYSSIWYKRGEIK